MEFCYKVPSAMLASLLRTNRRQKDKIVGRALVLFLLFVVPLVSGQTNSQSIEPEPSQDHALLKIDVRKFGYKPPGIEQPDRLSLAFTESNDILVAWTNLDDPHSKKTLRSNTPVPSHLHALVLDARTGQKQHGGEWPSRYLEASITPVGKENFLICAGDEIRLLSGDFTTVRDQVLSAPTTCLGLRLSPSRRSFSTRTKSGADNNLIDAESFQSLAQWSSHEAIDVHFTDTALVGACRPDFDLCIREFNQPWQPFHVDGIKQDLRAYGKPGPTFVNDTTFSTADGGKMVVVTLEGAILINVNLPKKFSFARIATSTGGQRFAYIETEERGSRALDMASTFDDHVVVYDLGQKKAIYTRKLNGGSPWIPPFEHGNRIALSADGTLLAILVDGIIEVYQLLALNS
jgi:hypothetical protein